MKQIKTFTLALAAALLLLAAGCTDERDNGGTGNIAPGTPVEINFDAPTVASNGTATRAAVPLPANTTVRITPYNKTKSRYESSVTYYVGTPADGKGKLIPYTSQNADGTFVTGNKMKVIMGDTYLFYISTPAKDITSEGYKQTVGNNEDYASAVSGDCIVTGGFVSKDFCFPPPTLVRRCSQITVEIRPASMQIASAPGGVKLSGLRSAQAGIAPGAAIPTTGGTYDQSYTVTTLQSEDTSELLYNSFCVLPGVSTVTITGQLVAILKPDFVNEVRKTVTYSAKVNFTEALKPGYRYQVRLVVGTENAEVLPTVTVTDWDMTGGNVHPGVGTDENPNYPYVTTNAEGQMSVIVLQDVFGGIKDMPNFSTSGYSLHEPWLQTPAHTLEFSILGVGASSSPIFEVAESNSPIGAAAWGSTNEGCTLPWRRPTYFEASIIKIMEGKLSGVDSFLDIKFWTATEFDNNRAWTFGDILNKTDLCYTRCVRDIEYSTRSYPYIIDGKYMIIKDVNGEADKAAHGNYTIHGKWPNGGIGSEWGDSDDLSVSAAFEVSTTTIRKMKWTSANAGCTPPWRRPTGQELKFLIRYGEYDLEPAFDETCYWSISHMEEFGGMVEYTEMPWEWDLWSITWAGSVDEENSLRCIRDL